MKARKLILAVGVAAALAGPASAGAMIQNDGGSLHAKAAPLHEVKGKAGHKLAAKSSATAIRVGSYNAYAYVQGGASSKVAKAIAKAGKKRQKPAASRPQATIVPVRPYVPVGTGGGGAGTDPDACRAYSVCTPEELCTIYGEGCLLLEHPAPVEISADAPPVDPATDEAPPADASASGTPADGSGAAAATDTADPSLLYQDC
jgi:hypothetical protein